MWIAKAELASAVANAGDMGFMTALTIHEAEELRTQIRRYHKLTDKPFGVNLTFLSSLRTIDCSAYQGLY
jgi:nitronate monooxygenase